MSDEDRLRQYLRKVAGELRTANRRVHELERRDYEPIAIVGMGCRYPRAVRSPADLWELVANGVDAVADYPDDRGWDPENLYHPDPDHAGTVTPSGGAFMRDIDLFDADFFGISPREALAMNPQQRIMLELMWEAFEDAGIDPTSLRGSDTGVFAGLFHDDYSTGPARALGSPELEAYAYGGDSACMLSGRLAYTAGLEGPTLSLDTACSSSLVAMHLACQALRKGDCSLALAGGVTVLSTPAILIAFSRLKGVSADGRCRSFAADADGVGLSEGAGLLVLERLSDARRLGHRVHGVVRGTAVNQDGASNGLTAPNGPAQERVIRQALADGGLSAGDVDVVEGHGTGTSLGDPIEAQALVETYGRARSDGPLRLGSIKSNIGHTQAAAGVAGVIKMIEAFRHDMLPRSLYCEEPSPHVDWAAGQIELLREPVEWPAGERPRRAGVSSFGMSGTNAHVIVEEAPAVERAPAPERSPELSLPVALAVSGRGEAGLRAQAERLREWLVARPELEPVDVAFSLVTTRAQLERRAAVVGTDRDDLLAGLEALAAGEPAVGVLTGEPLRGKTAFLFTGQGAQWAGMGRELYESLPVFAEAFDAACTEELKDVVFGDDEELLARTDHTQAALFALEVALFRSLEAWGVKPDFLIGHSIGELAAAHVAGVMSLEDALTLVTARGRLMAALPEGGAMLAIEAGEEEIDLGEGLSLAAVNGPRAIVVSGEEAAIAALEEEWRGKDRKTRRLDVSHAFHSHLIEPMLEEFRAVAAGLDLSPPRLAVVSNLTGKVVKEELTDPDYWVRHAREAVRFAAGIEELGRLGVKRFVEIGPDGVLTAMAQQTVEGGLFVPAMRAERDQRATLVTCLAALHTSGATIDWASFYAGHEPQRVDLPTYAFQRQSYWLESPEGVGDLTAAGQASAEHPLLGAAVRLAAEEGWLFTGRLSLASHPWLADHAVMETVILPGTAFVELALAAGRHVGAGGLDDLTLLAPLRLEEREAAQLQVTVAMADEDGRRPVNVYSRADGGSGDEDWVLHASGLLAAGEPAGADADLEAFAAAEWPPEGAQEVDAELFYDRLSEAGYDYGPAFQGLRRAYRDGDAWYAEIALAEGHADAVGGFCVHPALADAALHTALLAALEAEPDGAPEVPFSFSGVRVHQESASGLRVRVEIARDADGKTVRLLALDDSAAPALAIGTLKGRAVDQAALKTKSRGAQDALFAVEWVEVEGARPDGGGEPRAALLGGDGDGDDFGAAGVDLLRYPDLAALEHAIADGAEAPAVVLARAPADAPRADAPLAEAVRDGAGRTLELLQAWLASEPLADARLVLLTEGALAAQDGESPNLRQAALLGLVRSAQSENPMRVGLVDLATAEPAGAGLGDALASEEPEVALRDGRALAPRLARIGSDAPLVPPAGEAAWQLGSESAGTLENLALVPSQAAASELAPGQVRIAVHAAGLNFRDVLMALGHYPGQEMPELGGEGAGVVTEVGPDVEGLAAGDRVMGLIAGSMGPVATADWRHVTKIPDEWAFADAASVPIVFLTAYYGLFDMAGLERGETLLVHGAAGGVGMAALQLAAHAGADVFATAHPSKWETLKGLGVPEDRIASSRDLSFKDEFLARSEGNGVDVVLDSLAGEFVDASLELLPRGGRFVEIGKTDVRDAGEVASQHPGVRYLAFDLVEAAGSDRVQAMLREIVALFERGVLEHLPVSTFDVRRAPDAFRHMREASHVGKIVLSVPQPPDPEGTVLITGGTGGLGALVARHLAAQGARHLLLTSRGGPGAEGAEELLAALAELDCEAEAVACDIADRGQVEALFAAIPAERPLTAVVHAAGVLDDGVIASLDRERLERVMAPKVDGAINLHELTADLELSQFVMFSSVAATVGSPGQGNYSAANAFLDGLAHHRRARGLPATSLAWGAWERGMAGTVSDADRARGERFGMTPLSDDEGLELLDTARAAAQPLLVPVRLETATLRTQAKAGVLPAILQGVVRAPARRASSGSLARRLAGTPESERRALVLDLVRGHVASVLGHSSAGAVDPERAFKEMGFDSLTAVELRNRLVQATGAKLPATAIFDHPTPAAIADHLVSTVEAPAPSARTVRRAQTDEPIAIVGMSARYPGGVRSPEDLWRLVAGGTDAIGEFPDDRGWDADRLYDPDPDHIGTSYTRHGGFLDDAALFDSRFFSISPREALAMDPQQRLLLEGAWAAFEDAGIVPARIRGSQTGVFVGVVSSDYGTGMRHPDEVEGLLLTGTTASVASGRLSYVFGLEGPSLTVDTACSSSLVALHLACQALRRGECDMALTGGATVLGTPSLFVEFSRQRGLSQDGRCKAFGAGADGTGWAEGAGLLVLEPLSRAREQGHEVLALVRGSAVNQDGASNGLTAPNGPSQERVIRAALDSAGLSPADVDAVEGHGTGTALGDPIEAQALLATYGQERADGPLYLGSIKSNIGHSAAAAGVGGVIKMVEALRHETLPRTLHCEDPSPHVDWSEGGVELLREPVEWPAGERVRRAAVSSFGVSGTNAHVILEEAPDAGPTLGEDAGEGPVRRGGALPFLISAATPSALGAQAAQLASYLEARPELEPYEVASALALRRAHLPHRAVAVAAEPHELAASLRSLERGEPAEDLVRGSARDGATAFLFTGQGSQWTWMGIDLYQEFPVFAEALDEVCAELDQYLERPLREVMFAPREFDAAKQLVDTRFTQVALFALEIALFRLVRCFGIEPDYLMGHSIGEFSAAYVAGVFSLEDGCRLVSERARLMGALPEGGAMVAIEASEDEVAETVAGLAERVQVAAVNGPRAVTVSGEEEAVAEIEALWRGRERRTKRLRVSHAFHSHLMEPMLDELRAVAEGIELSEPKIPIVSNVTGERLTGEQACSPEYWVRHVRETVRFADGIGFLSGAGATRFIELGPDRTLSTIASQCVGDDAGELLFAGTLRGQRAAQRASFLDCLAAAHCHGVAVDWCALLDDRDCGRVELPTYAFERERYWLGSSAGPGDLSAAGQEDAEHPLLGAAVPLAGEDGWLFTGRLSLATHPWLRDHAVMGTVLLPSTAFVEIAVAAARRAGAGELEDLTLMAPLVIGDDDALRLQVSVAEPGDDGRRAVAIYSCQQGLLEGPGDAEWTLHASGLLASGDGSTAGDEALEAFASASWPPDGAEEVDVQYFYDRAAEAGYDYGPAFQGLRRAYRDGEAWYAEVALDGEHEGQAADFCLHPALSDAALHAILLEALERRGAEAPPQVPFSYSGVRLRCDGAASLRVRVESTEDGDDASALRLLAVDASGVPVLAIETLRARAVDPSALKALASARNDTLFSVQWVEVPGASSNGSTLEAALLASDDQDELGAGRVELTRQPDLVTLEQAIADGAPAPAVVLVRPAAAADGPLPEAVHAAAERTLGLLQAWLASEPLAEARLVLVTEGALPVTDDESPDLVQAALVGLLRSAQSENPGRFAVVDLDRAEASAGRLYDALTGEEPEVAIRDGRVLAPRLAREKVDDRPAAAEPDPRPEGTILITGGTGGLGALVARHLAAEHGARHLLLTSRTGGEADGVEELVAELEALGCEARVAACDVANRARLAEAIAAVPEEHPLTAVVHAAGVLDDGVIASLDGERLRTVMAPKVAGTVNLHELTEGLELSQFVLFSSAAATLGSPGQGNYAAANAFLDAFAHHRRRRGLPTTAVAWGAWERGMAGARSAADRTRLERLGMAALTDAEGLALLDSARAADGALLVPVHLEMRSLRAQAKNGMLPAILRGLVSVPARRATEASLAKRLAGTPEAEWEGIVLDLVRGHVASVLGHSSADAVEPQQSFKDLGFDSLSAVELRNRLTQATGVQLPAALVFDRPSPAAVAEYLLSKVEGTGATQPAIDDEIDRLDGMLRSLSDKNGERARIGRRLRSLVASLAGDGSSNGDGLSDDMIESASESEILALIDEELDRS